MNLTNGAIMDAFGQVLDEQAYDNLGSMVVGQIKYYMVQATRTAMGRFNNDAADTNYIKYMVLVALFNGLRRSMEREQQREGRIGRIDLDMEQCKTVAERLIGPVIDSILKMDEDGVVAEVQGTGQRG